VVTQYYLYRVTVGEATRTILATGEAAAVKQSGGTCAVELHPYPMMLLEDMRKEWPQLRQSDEGIEVVRKWMRAAREIGLIDAEQHARMFEVVEAAKEARL
jgi:hypothetical protein